MIINSTGFYTFEPIFKGHSGVKICVWQVLKVHYVPQCQFLSCVYLAVALFRSNPWLPCCCRYVHCAIWHRVTPRRRWPRMLCACTMACLSWLSCCTHPVAGRSSRPLSVWCVTWLSALPTMPLWGNMVLCPASCSSWSVHTKTHKGWVAAALTFSYKGSVHRICKVLFPKSDLEESFNVVLSSGQWRRQVSVTLIYNVRN